MPEISLMGLALQGFATGFGVIVAEHLYEMFIRPKVEQARNQKVKLLDKLKDINEGLSHSLGSRK